VGVHTVRVRVEDNVSPVMGDEKQFQITVQNRPTRLVYDGKTSGQYSDESTLSATLKDDGVAPLGGTALVNKTVDFYYNNVKVGSGTTDVNGKASYDYVIPSAAGSNTVEARYAGDGGYDASTSGSSAFNVNRENAEGLSVSNAGAAQVGVKSFTVSVGVKEARLGNGNEPDPNDGQFPGSIANDCANRPRHAHRRGAQAGDHQLLRVDAAQHRCSLAADDGLVPSQPCRRAAGVPAILGCRQQHHGC